MEAPVHTRRILDDHSAQTLTITHAQLADAVRRVMLCDTPAITQGIWNVLRHETDLAAQAAEQQRTAAYQAQQRALHQKRLEDAFGGLQ